MLNSHLPFDKTEETKQQNRRFPQQHQALWEKKELTSMHASQEHHTIYAANVSSKKDCSHCSSWFGAGALPLSHGKSPRELAWGAS
jgi:hypothetical protein